MSEHIHNIDDDLADLPFRVPIVAEQKSDSERISEERRWRILCASAQRAIGGGEDTVARHFSRFGAAEVQQQTAGDFLQTAKEASSELDDVVEKYGQPLVDAAELPIVPEQRIPHGIRDSRGWYSPDDARRELEAVTEYYPSLYDDEIQRIHARIEDSAQLSKADEQLVIDRYRRARDVKLLGMMAEWRLSPPQFQSKGETMSAELNNGTQVVLDKGALETYPALADPSQWEKRIQLKDRVYEVTIAGKSFIMKEQKTSRHTDVHADHVTGAASRDEFAIAKTMADTGVTVHGDVRLEWERPVGYAELPDGYQFCLFKKVEQAMDYRISTIGKVAEQIKQREGAYAEEFATTLERINELRQLRPDLFESLPGDQMPTFEEFAAAKADALFTQIERDVERGILRAGFIDDDHKAFMITLDDSRGTDQRVQITAIGMDYEFFAADAKKSAHRLAEMDEEERTGEYGRRSLSLAISDMSMETILSLVLAEKMGMALPPNVPSD